MRRVSFAYFAVMWSGSVNMIIESRISSGPVKDPKHAVIKCSFRSLSVSYVSTNLFHECSNDCTTIAGYELFFGANIKIVTQ